MNFNSLFLRIALFFMILTGFWSCQDQVAGTAGAGNPEITASVDVKASGMSSLARRLDAVQNPSLLFRDSSGRIYRVDQAFLYLGAVKIEALDEAADRGMEVKAGPFLVDLKNNQSTPILPEFKLKPDWYEGVELKLSPAEDHLLAGMPDEMKRYSLYLSGVYMEKNGAEKPYKIRLAISEDWIVGYQDSVYLSAQSKLSVNFDLAATGLLWDAGSCALLQSDTLDISTDGKDACVKAALRFKEALRQSSKCTKEK